ncbi:MAG: adenylyl-sulfate kinase [Actinomycetales bacterium]
MTPTEQLAASGSPVLQLTDRAVADLQLVLDGVTLPWPVLGGSLSGAAAGEPSGSSTAVTVPADLAEQALTAGSLVLCDREQTPIAALGDLSQPLAVADGESHADGHVLLQGTVLPLRARETRLFLDRAATPDKLGTPAGPRRVVVTGRPLLSDDVDHLAGDGGELLVLVPVEGPTPDGLPPVTLMRAVWPVVDGLGPLGHVVAVPVAWRDAASDEALARSLGAAYGATATTLVTGGAAWGRLVAALDRPEQLPQVAEPAVLAELRRWRPVPSRRGAMILFTGFSGSGKSTLARDLAAHVVEYTARTVSLLDGDDVRRLLSSGLGFDRAGRDLNVRRIGYVGSEIARHGGLAVCAPIAPYAESRAAVRAMVEPVGEFVLVHVSTPLEECERRDLKGLYAKARAGLIPEFTGISDPYDVPTDADLAVDTSQVSRETALGQVLDLLRSRGLIDDGSAADHDPSRTTLAKSES